MTKSVYDNENIESLNSIIAYEIEEYQSNKWSQFTKAIDAPNQYVQ